MAVEVLTVDEKLTRTQLRQVKKVATGPLLGPIEPAVPAATQGPEGGAETRVAPLGPIQGVRARIDGQSGEA